jgi:hypothetical protein
MNTRLCPLEEKATIETQKEAPKAQTRPKNNQNAAEKNHLQASISQFPVFSRPKSQVAPQ